MFQHRFTLRTEKKIEKITRKSNTFSYHVTTTFRAAHAQIKSNKNGLHCYSEYTIKKTNVLIIIIIFSNLLLKKKCIHFRY